MRGRLSRLLVCILSFSTVAAFPQSAIELQIEKAVELQDKGDIQGARRICEALLSDLRHRGASPQLGRVLNVVSQIAAADGNYDESGKLAQEAAETYHTAGDVSGEAHAFNNKGIAEIQQGSYPRAQQDLERALGLARQTNDGENQVQVLNNLGSAFFYQGKYLEGLRSYENAMALVEKSPAANWSGYWRQITDFNQATLYQRLGRYEKALEIYRRVEQSSKDLTAGDRAHLFANLGTLYRRLGDPWKALDSYSTARALYSKAHDADGELSVLKNIGIVYALDEQDPAKAQPIFEEALKLAEKSGNRREEMQGHLYLGQTYLRKRDLASTRKEFESAEALAKELGTPEEQWKGLYGLGQIDDLSGQGDAAEEEYRQAIAIIEQARYQLQLSALRAEFLAEKRDAYDALILRLLQKKDFSGAFLYVERSRARTFQDRLAPQSEAKPLTMEETQAHLPPATVLLESWVSGDWVGFVWCTPERTGAWLKKVTVADRERMRAFLKGIPEGQDGPPEVLGALLPENGDFLPSGVEHVLVVPDGWLSFVPFEMLPAARGAKQLLIEKYDVTYLPSAALLRRERPSDRRASPWAPRLVGFGDPVVRAQADSLGAVIQPLPFSGEEVRSIAAMAGRNKELFLEEDDLKNLFLAGKASGAPVLHVSTHAFADADNPENSRMLFSPASPDGTADYVFLRELYDLDLRNVKLATISACDTERGKMVRGEGVQAFSRALLSAGAGASLTTLWRVDDQATAEFMKQFYFFALEKRQSKAEALRSAKLKFLNSETRLAEPRYWASFVLNGDGATPVPSVWSWSTLAVFGVGLLALASMPFWALRLRRR